MLLFRRLRGGQTERQDDRSSMQRAIIDSDAAVQRAITTNAAFSEGDTTPMNLEEFRDALQQSGHPLARTIRRHDRPA